MPKSRYCPNCDCWMGLANDAPEQCKGCGGQVRCSEEPAFLRDVMKGDTLIEKTPKSRTVVEVVRVTDTQIVIGHLKFRKKDGRPVGRQVFMSSNNWLVIPAPGEIDELCGSEARKDLALWVARECHSELLLQMSTEKLLRIKALLEMRDI